MKRRGLFSIFVATVLVAVLLIFLISFQVRRNECAIVFTFGRVARALTEPGLYWKLPYPIQTVQRYDTRIRVFESKFDEVTTADGKNLIVTMAIGWSIEDPVQFYKAVATPGKAETQLASLVGSERNTVFSRHPLAHFVSADPLKLALSAVASEIEAPIQKKAREEYGARIHFVLITHQGVPESVTAKVFERMKAERKSIADKYLAEGKSEAEKRRAEADRKKAETLSEAERVATEARGEGDAAAAKHYAEFQKNPELAILLRKIDALRRLKEGTTLVLDFRTPPYDVLRQIPVITGAEPAPRPKADDTPQKKDLKAEPPKP